MIFGGTVIDKQFTLTTDESYPYNIQRHGWKTRTRNSVFDPHEATLRDIDYIYDKFNFPENPLSNAEPPKRRREHIDNMQLLSPPRRVRRCGIEQLTASSSSIHEIPYEDTKTACSQYVDNIRQIDSRCQEQIYESRPIRSRMCKAVCPPVDNSTTTDLPSCSQEQISRSPIDSRCQEQIYESRPIRSRRCKAVCPPVDNSTTTDGPSCSQEQITNIQTRQTRPQRTRRKPQFLNDYECN
ncbi:uncharacterized protein LOC111033358 [Myzus persicae]|uniref:uncharacterized protein LOC111033358 n=1 Tax=Myzus persicae TaxID=13164 RepID=UPI000B93558A|nr:uncharacterized protein LOC111033358 [Myzus persicae]